MGAAIGGGHALIASVFNVSGTAIARIATLALLVAAGLAVYLGCIQAFGVARLSELRAAVRKQL